MADWYFRGKNNGLKSCPGCRNLVRTNEEFCPYCAKRLRPESGARGWFRQALAAPEIATRFFIGLCVAVFFLQAVADLLLPGEYRSAASGGGLFSLLVSEPYTYIRLGSNYQPFVAFYQQYWRFVTYCFLHLGLLHIGFNCYAFWDLGRLAERMWGARQVFATFILTGIAGGAASYGWNMSRGIPVNSAGASGAICGILGLFLGAYYKNRFQVGEFLGTQLKRWAVYILVFGLVMKADNAAHIGGMLAGAVLGYFLPPTNHSRHLNRDRKVWNIAAGLSLVLMLAAFACAAWFYLQGPDHVRLLLRGMR